MPRRPQINVLLTPLEKIPPRLKKERGSVSRFSLMLHCRNNGNLPVVVVESDVAAATKGDWPFSMFGFHVIRRTTDFRMLCEDFYTLANCAYRLLRCGWIFLEEETMPA